MAEVDRCIGPSSKQLVQLLKNGLLGELSRQAYEGSLDREDKFRRRMATTR
jgi:hypothetical protein